MNEADSFQHTVYPGSCKGFCLFVGFYKYTLKLKMIKCLQDY